MIRLLYNVIFSLLFLLVWPYYLNRMRKRGRVWRKMAERLAVYERGTLRKLERFRHPVWFHAVSVGEMRMALPLIRELRRHRPQQDVIMTTTTVTGRDIGEVTRDDHTLVLYHPLDFGCCVRKAFAAFRPSMLILIDQELWPNHIWEARDCNVPVWMVNARMSERSAHRFTRFRGLLRSVLKHLEVVCLQMEADVERFRRAGFPAHALFVRGSLKFGVPGPNDESLAETIRTELGWGDAPVLLGGSTHPGEEQILTDIFLRLREDYPALRLVLVPRHAERREEVEQLLLSRGLQVRVRRAPDGPDHPDVLLVDTTGELAALYGLGTIVFVGKSLCGGGGQNFIEAAEAGRPILLGSRMGNFRDLHRLFREAQAVLTVEDADELEQEVRRLLNEPEERQRLAKNALQVCQKHSGTHAVLAEMIDRRLASLEGVQPTGFEPVTSRV